MRLDESLTCAGRRREIRDRIGLPRKRRSEPGDIELGADEVVPGMFDIGGADGGIELDHHVARLDGRAVANTDCAHDAGFERLDGFGPTAGDDFARSGCHHVDRAEARPDQGNAEHRDDRCADGAADRRRRCLDDLERRRQERRLVVAAASLPVREFDDLPDRRHWIPACR